jgi:hypothetical protein
MKRKTSPATKQGQSNIHGNSIAAQQQRLDAELRKNPVSTTYAREYLDILMPAARVWELRHIKGLNIKTHWKTIQTACGNKHRLAEYVLFPGQWEGKTS